jgi:ubiquinone/menaquinone biosynthesis C-methylase UbiE
MDSQTLAALQATYDRVADEYTRRIADELQHKPLDREWLARLAERLHGRGVICDMGCGPGHVARFLRECGATVAGVDLSPGMLEQARGLNPEIEFRQGNLLALDVPDETWAGIAAFYSIVHVPRADVPTALAEFKRTLQPGGLLMLAFHAGDEILHLDEWWERPVSADWHFFRSEEMLGYLRAAGFVVEDAVEREPYPDVEHPSRRAYILARKPAPPLAPDELLALYDRELRVELDDPDGRRESFPRLVRIVRPAPRLNMITYSRLDPGELDAVAAEQVAYFRQFDQPFEWVVCEHDDPPDLVERLIALGFARDDDPSALMVLDLDRIPAALQAPVSADVRRLTTPAEIEDVARVEQRANGGDFSWLAKRLNKHVALPDYLSVYGAYVDGEPASAAWVYFYPGTYFAGCFGGATAPEHRGRGLYRALVAARAQEALRRGCRFVTVGAGPLSRPILARCGFERITWAHSMRWKGEA